MRRTALLAFVCTVAASTAHGQVLDHLKCHKMKDPLKLKATADFTALDSQFSASGCTISKAKLFCVPATKSNVQPPEAAPLDIDGQQLQNAFICYSAKCPGTPPDTGVADQFGSRTEIRYSTSLVCAPAIEGTVTTTTTLQGATTTTTMSGGGTTCGTSAYPECNGPCPTQGSVCADSGNGHCGCFASAPPCGQYQGPPTCSGGCSSGTPYCKTIGSGTSATCVCSAIP